MCDPSKVRRCCNPSPRRRRSRNLSFPVDEVAEAFIEAVRGSGLRLDERLIEVFLAAALTKPFLILTGLSGSGKTQLATRLGEWCGSDSKGLRYQVVPVRPDWTGPEYLFGFPDALQNRVDDQAVWAVPDTLEFLLRANADPTKPFVLVLDEMNLAHVERYFADFLSGLESREPVLPDLHVRGGKWLERDGSRKIPLPRNVTVVGTVNIDETTYLFSPKVLDRAFTFEFRVVDSDLDPGAHRPGPSEAATDDILGSLVTYQQHDEWQFDHPHPERDALADDLRNLHRVLSPAGLEFGHRVMYEALRLASMLGASRGLGRDEVLDAIALTKVLPKIHGSRQRLQPVLETLITFAEGSPETPEPRLPATVTKARRMLKVPSRGAIRELYGVTRRAHRTPRRGESNGWVVDDLHTALATRRAVRTRRLGTPRACGGWRLSVRDRYGSPPAPPSRSSRRPNCSASTMRVIAEVGDPTAAVCGQDSRSGRPRNDGPVRLCRH